MVLVNQFIIFPLIYLQQALAPALGSSRPPSAKIGEYIGFL